MLERGARQAHTTMISHLRLRRGGEYATHPDGVKLVGDSHGEGSLEQVGTAGQFSPKSKDRRRPTPSRAADRVCPGGVGAPGACIAEKCRAAPVRKNVG